MKILFDQGTPAPLRGFLNEHVVSTAYEMGWSALANGALLSAAEAGGFQALVTTDQSMRYQQHVTGRSVGVLVLPTTDWNTIRRHTSKVAAALAGLRPGEIRDVSFDD
jgi:hypothetical protein